MNNWIIIAIGAGLTAAALHATVVSGSPAALVLFYLAPLPLFLAGLGWGPVAAGLGGLAGAVVLALTIGLKPGLFFIISTAVAPVVLSHLSLINRPAAAGSRAEGEAGDSETEWYPEGRLILWCAVIACVLMTVTIFVVGGSAEGFQATVRSAMDAVVGRVAEGVDPDQLIAVKSALDVFARLAAPLAASIWLLATLFNMWAASRILDASGRSPRPWAPFASYALPKSAGYVLAGVTLAALLPGTLGLIAMVGLALMVTAYTVIGLATLHGLTLGNPMRVFILASTYFALFVLSWIVIIPLVVLGVVDQQFGLRTRQRAGTGNSD